MPTPATYEQEVERWRAARLARLVAPTGWLSLVDRVVLDPGDNDVGIGTATLAGGEVRFRAREGVAVTLRGQPVVEQVLAPDDGGAPDRLVSAGRTYELHRRGDFFAFRAKDPNAPARLGFPGLDHFPLDARWRIEARFERYEPPRETFHVYDIGTPWRRQVPGRAHFAVDGQALSLEPVLDEDSQRLFFTFADATNRGETYAAGRFLYAPVPAGDEVVLDFNLAFNPPCAFTPYALCPVTPPENRLPLAVRAGERRVRDR
jgi:uncharacterized protein (DUF1684 family)